MKKLYTFIITITFAFSANAQFSGDYDPANWTLSGVSLSSDASVDTSGAPASIIFNGNDSDSGDCCSLFDDYSVTVATTGYISFAYDFNNPDIEEFYYIINGTQTFITDFTETGTINDIPVTAGDEFGFRIYTDDDCCGRGVAIISAFSFDVTLGNEDAILSSSEINFYPTPNSGKYSLSYLGNDALKLLSVFSVSGKHITNINLENFNNNSVIDLTNLSKGLYLMAIESNNGSRITKKLVVK